MKAKLLSLILLSVLCLPSFAEGGNNNRFWYARCMYMEYGSNGELDTGTARYIYPQNKELFEIQFVYSGNYENAAVPVEVYLHELDGQGKPVKSEKIVSLLRRLSSSVEFKPENVNLFGNNCQLTVGQDGTITLFRVENAEFKSVKMFQPNESVKPIYKVRYEVLRERLSNIAWGK